jgi:hypothetical protein
MLKLIIFIGFFILLGGVLVAYGYLIFIARENEMPGIEDIETGERQPAAGGSKQRRSTRDAAPSLRHGME